MTTRWKEGAVPRRRLVLFGFALLAAALGSDVGAWSGHGGGHGRGHAGHFGGGFGARIVFVPRAVFFAAPVAYYAPAYYPPPAYYNPPAYYPPVQPLAYYPPPAQSAPPRPAYYDPPASVEPSRQPIYSCRDGNGRTYVTNRKEDTIGKDCVELSVQNTPAPRASNRPPATTASATGPYAAQDALRYRFFCPDTRKFYPEVNICDAAWLKVVPNDVAATR